MQPHTTTQHTVRVSTVGTKNQAPRPPPPLLQKWQSGLAGPWALPTAIRNKMEAQQVCLPVPLTHYIPNQGDALRSSQTRYWKVT